MRLDPTPRPWAASTACRSLMPDAVPARANNRQPGALLTAPTFAHMRPLSPTLCRARVLQCHCVALLLSLPVPLLLLVVVVLGGDVEVRLTWVTGRLVGCGVVVRCAADSSCATQRRARLDLCCVTRPLPRSYSPSTSLYPTCCHVGALPLCCRGAALCVCVRVRVCVVFRFVVVSRVSSCARVPTLSPSAHLQVLCLLRG